MERIDLKYSEYKEQFDYMTYAEIKEDVRRLEALARLDKRLEKSLGRTTDIAIDTKSKLNLLYLYL